MRRREEEDGMGFAGHAPDPREQKEATPAAELWRQLVDSNMPKSEREWWALGEIERLRDETNMQGSALINAESEIARLQSRVREMVSAELLNIERCVGDNLRAENDKLRDIIKQAEAKIEELKKLVILWKENNRAVFGSCDAENMRLRHALREIAKFCPVTELNALARKMGGTATSALEESDLAADAELQADES